jgi:hypothetical protein
LGLFKKSLQNTLKCPCLYANSYVTAFLIIIYGLGLRADMLMLVLMHCLKGASGDVDVMHAELLELCGDHLVYIITMVITNKDALLAEFQVCHNVFPYGYVPMLFSCFVFKK